MGVTEERLWTVSWGNGLISGCTNDGFQTRDSAERWVKEVIGEGEGFRYHIWQPEPMSLKHTVDAMCESAMRELAQIRPRNKRPRVDSSLVKQWREATAAVVKSWMNGEGAA